MTALAAFVDELFGSCKVAKILTTLQPHQQRVVDRISREDQPGLVVAHGLGTGKTLTSIAAIEELGGRAAVLVPASLVDNYRKELAKHTDGSPDPAIVSLQRTALEGKVPEADVLVIDEAHRARETKTKTYQTLKRNTARKRLLLTASPFYNRPSDIAPLVNIAAGARVFPTDPREFAQKYITEKKVGPGFWGRVKGIRPGVVPVLNPRERRELSKNLKQWVDYHPGKTEGFPDVTYEDIKVPMTKEQRKIYDSLLRKAPPWLRHKVRKGMPPSKQESRDLNAFMTGLRQVSLSTAPYITKGESREAKVEAAFQNLKKTLSEDDRNKVVVYSNYLVAGLEPYKKRLDAEGIPYGEFTGAMKKKERDRMVRDYNDGRIRTLLLSSAGGEGLDLKGTSVIQVLEPHWNREKLRQVEGRGIRYKSHEHLPPEKRNVLVQRYLATIPRTKLLERARLVDPGQGADEYLSMLSDTKDRLNQQFKDLLGGIQKKSSMQSRDPGFAGAGYSGGTDGGGIGGGGSVIPDYAGKNFVDRKETGKKVSPIIKVGGGGAGGGFNGWSPANNTTDPISESFVDPLASAKIQMREKRRKIAKMAGAAIKTLTWGGLTMKFEYLTGQTRSGMNKATGKSWSRKMRDNYGYIPGTYGKGADGEAIDVYFADDPVDGPVFKIRQRKKTGEYDEDKFMVGYGSATAAKGAFLRNMPEWAFGSMMSMSMRGFRRMVGQSDRKVRVPSDGGAERDRVRKALKGRAA